MRASILALAFTSLVLVSAAASAEEKAQPAVAQQPAGAKLIARGVWELDPTVVPGRPMFPHAVVDVARALVRAPLAELRQPLVDRLDSSVEKDPF